MIAIVRKNLFMSPNSFIYNSVVHLSTTRTKTVNPSKTIYDLLADKHQFSPKVASAAALHFSRVRSPKIAESVISFLKENSFTSAQMEKVILYNPRLLGYNTDDLKLKLKLFQDLGLSSEEIAKFMTNHMSVLHSSSANKIVPSLSVLHGLLGSNDNVARLLRKCGWFITHDLERILMPNLEILKSCGIPRERIIHFLYTYPRSLLIKPNVMRKATRKATEIGVPQSSKVFIHAVIFFAYTSKGAWEVKLQTLRDLGFSADDAMTMFKKTPLVFLSSQKKMKKLIKLLLATGKYNVSNIVNNSSSLGSSIEKRLEPRLKILKVLERRNLIDKWPGLSCLSAYKDDVFFDRFVRPFIDAIGEEVITKTWPGRSQTKSTDNQESGTSV